MLIRFSVENFLCFKEEASLSMIASSDERHPEHLIGTESGRAPLLRAAGIYGANGHGKTKLVEAMQFLERLVLKETDRSAYGPVRPFKFSSNCKGKPSRFVIEFRVGTSDYELGVVLDDNQIHEEWLYARYNTREVLLYERSSDDRSSSSSGFKFGSRLKRSKSPNSRFRTEDYLEFLATGLERRQLFLSEAVSKGVFALREPFEWFHKNIFVITAEASYGFLQTRAHEEADFLPFISEFIRDADTGIRSLSLERTKVSPSILERLSEDAGADLKERLDQLEDDDEIIIAGREGPELVLHKGEDGEAYTLAVVANHVLDDASEIRLDLADESSGTRRLIDLLPMMRARSTKEVKVFIVDELDRKLHPLLAYKLLESILQCSDIQIVFTTHNTLLLSLDLFRRDEIWFVQKKKDQSVDLYSLADFKVRPDLDVRRGYLNGRFGAIPFLGNLQDLGWCASSPSEEAQQDAHQS